MNYRLHIDIPLGADEEQAIYKSRLLVEEFFTDYSCAPVHILNEKYNITQANYRLGHDEDRQRSNYLDKDENDHVSNKKCRVNFIVEEESDVFWKKQKKQNNEKQRSDKSIGMDWVPKNNLLI